MKKLSYEEIVEVIDKDIKYILDRKNSYIQKNGYDKFVGRFDTQIATLTGLYSVFKEACNENN